MIEKWDAFPLLYLKDVLILLRQFHIVIVYAPVAQGIEHRSPKAGVVRSNRIWGTTKHQAIGSS